MEDMLPSISRLPETEGKDCPLEGTGMLAIEMTQSNWARCYGENHVILALPQTTDSFPMSGCLDLTAGCIPLNTLTSTQ